MFHSKNMLSHSNIFSFISYHAKARRTKNTWTSSRGQITTIFFLTRAIHKLI